MPPRKCTLCDTPGHTRRSCPFIKDADISKQSVFCHDCVFVSIPYKTKIEAVDVEGKKAEVNHIICGRCESSHIEYLHQNNKTIRVKQKAKIPKAHDPNINAGETCCICFETYSTSRNMAVTLCGHAFCLECILKHSKEKSNCPLCRSSLFHKQQNEVSDNWKQTYLYRIRTIMVT